MPIVVFGLDGADPELIDRWIDDLPNFAKVKEKGFYGGLESIKPPITVPAWMCMFSGKNPGQFNAWDFGKLNFNNYEIEPVSSEMFKGKTVISDDKDTISFRVPGTTPPYKINGEMISGFMKAEEMDFESEELEKEIRQEFSLNLKSMDEDSKQEVAKHNFKQNSEVFRYLLENKEFERAFSVFRIIDTYMHDVKSESGMKEAYIEADKYLGQIRELCVRNGWNLLVVSDHGSGETKKKFYLNAWLKDKGYASYKKSEKSVSVSIRDKIVQTGLKLGLKSFMKKVKNEIESKTSKNLQPGKGGIMKGVDFQESKAFSNLSAVSNFGAIWINDEERFSKGIVEDKESVVEDIKQELIKEDFVQEVYIARDLDFSDQMPDILVEANKEVVVGGELYTNKFHETKAVVHNKKGLWMAAGPDFKQLEDELHTDLINIAPTIQAIDGIVSRNDGKPVEKALKNPDLKYEEKLDIEW